MISSASEISEVSRFAPLFQLWAGVCILCFYGELLNKLIASESRAKIENQLNDFKQNLHGLMSDQTHSYFSMLIDSSLNNYKSCIIHIGKLSFCYCVFILLASAMEEFAFARMKIIFFVIAYVLYSCYVMFNQRVVQSYRMWSFLIPTIILLLIFAYPFDNATIPISEQTMGIIMLLSLLAAPLFCILRYYLEQDALPKIKESTDRIEESFQTYSRWKSLPIKDNLNKIKDPIIRGILSGNDTVKEKQDRADGYFYDQITRTFDLLRFEKYIGYVFHKKKEDIASDKPTIRFYSAIYLLIAFYIFMVISCWMNAL